MSFAVKVDVSNPSGSPVTFTIPQGRILAPKGLGKSQSLVVQKSVTTTVPAGAKQSVFVEADCIDPPLPPPADTPMTVTVFGIRQRRRRTVRDAL